MSVAFAAPPRFYPDDPLLREPEPKHVQSVRKRKLSDFYDLFLHSLADAGERQPAKGAKIPARGVNTLGEVPDSAWYRNRHGSRPMSIEDLVRGPGTNRAPSVEGPWTVLSAKSEGVTPGFLVQDSNKRRYFLKFDPITNPEMATAADVIGSKFFHALGYYVPENYLVTFSRSRLVIGPKANLTDSTGTVRPMTPMDVDEVLLKAPSSSDGEFRVAASLFLDGDPVGPFKYYGVRRDDPNDVIPHEHRRDLRGLFVFAAWLGHDDSRAINTLDTMVEEGGRRYLRHHLIDFGSILGSASYKANSARSGNESLFAWKPAALEVLSLGLYAPAWTRAKFPDLPSVGRFESQVFSPEKYRTEYPNPAFENHLPDDAFWAAKQVMAFSDEQIREIVRTGLYSDPKATEWVVKCLIERRDKIGRAYFAKVLPLDRFNVRDGRLVWEDLGSKYKVAPPSEFEIEWAEFDNATQAKTRLPNTKDARIPDVRAQFLSAGIRGADPKKTITVYLRHHGLEWQIVGIDRTF